MEKFKIPKSFLVLMWNVGLDAEVSWMQNSLTVTWGCGNTCPPEWKLVEKVYLL